jgi:endonuclease/exonuclease/phosphatase family metal-dependent hydrolase
MDVIRREAPAIIGLQEALRFQIDEILNEFPQYRALGVGRDADGGGEYSTLLYTERRFRVLDQGTFWYSSTPLKPGSKTWGNTLPRICTWAQFEATQSACRFYVYNTHFDHRSQPSREASARLLVEMVEKQPDFDPVIITGDLNAGEDNPAIKSLKGESGPASERPYFMDSFRVVFPEREAVGTFNGFEGRTQGEKIDYVLTSPDIQVLKARIVRTHAKGRYPSDHFPVAATLSLTCRP